MTHIDIYTKFMIEYDKANVTSSYPSLTEYEVATVLDKAYNALIALKVTGNNVRRSTFESDIKAIADLSPLVVTDSILRVDDVVSSVPNLVMYRAKDDMLYFLQAVMQYKGNSTSLTLKGNADYKKYGDDQQYDPIDNNTNRSIPVKLVNHEIAKSFFSSAYNMPWMKQPVCYIENNYINVVYDPIDHPVLDTLYTTYIKYPSKFVKDLDEIDQYCSNLQYNNLSITRSYFQFSVKDQNNAHNTQAEADVINKFYSFECNDTVAEELISLAIAFALENIESSRLNSKLNMRGLEA